MEDKLYTPQEAADILKLKKNTIYDMIKKGKLNATKMGKQFRIRESELNRILNPDNAHIAKTDSDIYQAPHIYSEPVRGTNISYMNTTGNIVVSGQDLVLDMLCSTANANLGIPCFVRSYEGSYNGLYAMYKDEVQIASAHIWDGETDTYNLPYISKLLPGEELEVYRVLSRPIGLYVAKGNPLGITGISDFVRDDVSIINREKGSGARIMLDQLLHILSLDASRIKGYDRAVNSHLASAAMISKGGADVAIGTQNTAMQFANVIDFVFLKDEDYDLVFRKSDLKKAEIRTLLQVLQSTSFKAEVDAMGLYNTENMGQKMM